MRETYNIFSVCILHFLHLRGDIFSDIFSVSYILLVSCIFQRYPNSKMTYLTSMVYSISIFGSLIISFPESQPMITGESASTLFL